MVETRRRPATVRVFLLDGTPAGPRTVERLGWTGHCIVASRGSYAEIRGRREFDFTGVYLLVTEESDESQSIYVGEADVARKRLDQWVRDGEEWTRFILFTSKDHHLNKALAKNIEARLVDLGRRAKRSRIENGNVPPAPQLHESEKAEVENFLEEMLNLLPLVGVTAFEIPKLLPQRSSEPEELSLSVGRAIARGMDLPEGFLVRAGARGTTELASSFSRTVAFELRKKLLDEGVLTVKGDAVELTQDYLFNSPSLAAALLVGYPISGPQNWRNASGKPLRELQAEKLGPAGKRPDDDSSDS